MSQSSPLVTVGVCTYKRPEGIAKCLRSLIDQQTSVPFDIVVTENDASQGSKAVIEQIAEDAKDKGIEIRYYCEPEPNISIARNRCVAECRGEFLAFIDDDEWAEPDWLEKLVEVQREHNADITYGTVVPEYEPGFPEYLKGIRDYQHMFHEGQKLESAASGCTMYRLKCLQYREGPFDLSYGKTGGEDSELAFYLFQIHNILIIKTFKAIAPELQPASRGKCRYYWKRSYRESYIAARLFNQYYYRMAGLKVNGIHFFNALKGLLINCVRLLIKPRRAFAGIGMNIATMAGIIAFYLGRKNTNHSS
ncbi:MAG: glycosyltransferase family 2 protein [Thermoguttaceae bacterium]|nr:glycosyltransferase family 2 protein [Thermoguttaceae bacterium]